jgi:hypothetical protein
MAEEIAAATQHTLRALTLSEKALAHELFFSEQYYESSRSVWLRAPSYNLHEAIAKARAGTKTAEGADFKFPVRNYYVSCDTLVIDSLEPIVPDTARVWKIEINARRIVAPKATSSSASLVLQSVHGCEITFSTPQLPDAFEVEFIVGGNAKRIKPVVDPGNFSILIAQDDESDELHKEQLPAPDSFMNTLSYLDRITEDGKLKPTDQRNDDLPRLLQMQVLIAQAHIGINKPLSIDLLNYVIAATSDKHSLQLNYQTISLRNSLIVDSDVVCVPSVNIYASKQVLKARLAAAKAFEDGFQNFSNLLHDSKNRTAYALDLLAKSDDVTETYRFLLGIRQREYDNAVTAYKKASTVFTQNEKSIEGLKAAFEAGIAKYKKKQELKAVGSIFKSIFKVVVAIGVTVATAGAAAPAAIGAAGSAANTAAKTVSLFKKLKDVFEKLKKIYEKIKPVIEKLKKMVDTATKVVEELRKLNEATDAAKGMKADATSPDVFNATAEWRRFNLTLIDMEETLKEYDIEGKGPFFMALKTLVINGEAFIQTQANLVVKGDELATIILQQKMEKRNHDRMSKMAYTSSTDETVFGLLRRAMFDRLLQIRGLVYSDFSTYVAAYNYHTMLPGQVISLSPVKPVVDYLEDAAKLQAAVVSFGSRALIQSRKFELRTLAGFSSGEELAAELAKGSVIVNVTPTEDIFKGFTRIRMSSVRCYLDGAKINEGESLQLQLRTGGHFFDRDVMDRQAGAESSEPGKAVLTRSFLGDSRQLLFEYTPGSDAIVCDGKFGQILDYTKHTPMTTWDVQLAGGAKARKRAGLDLSGFKELVMQFECDAVWMGVDATVSEEEEFESEDVEGGEADL